MKIALITDTHWGIRNDSPVMLSQMKKFLDEVFFPVIDRDNIDTVIHLGDLVDRRKYINYVTAKRLRDDFLEPLRQRDIDVHIIAGNHDTYFKNTNDVNSLRELLDGKYYNFNIYDNVAAEMIFEDKTKIFMLPWICDENREQCMKAIDETTAPILMGHLELNGFEMYRGQVNEHGDDPKLFDKFDLVCSGHYHTRSSRSNIHYLGTPAQYTWSDYGDTKGFYVLDTETRGLTFIENPYKIFYKFHYDDINKQMDEVIVFDAAQYKDTYVKVIVKNKTNPYWFDLVIDKIEKAGPADIQIVEDHLNLNLEDDTDIVNEAEDTITIIRKFVDSMNVNTDKKRVENIIQSLYIEAHEIE